MTLNEVRAALSLSPAADDISLSGVSTDTRDIGPGVLFVALRGENFDGHTFIDTAFQNGAAAALVEDDSAVASGPLVIVLDTKLAYGLIASAWRSRHTIPVVAVTGSVGKTTMKEMIALTLSSLGPVLKTELNENNELGVPKTLLRISAEHRAVVVELGMRGPGQIKYLAEICQPTVGVITMIGESHIELLGSKDAIADAKGELIAALTPGAVAVINADDPYFAFLAAKTGEKVVRFGSSTDADVQITGDSQSVDGRLVELTVDRSHYSLRLQSIARHDVTNATGAVATAIACGVSVNDAIHGVEQYRPSHMRMEVFTSKSGATILSDCYNAAPTSVKSALNTLRSSNGQGKKIAFLGDMRELGSFAKQMHQDVADEADRLGLGEIYPIGDSMREAFPRSTRSFGTAAEAAVFVRDDFQLSSDQIVLVKGSRALELEKIVEALVLL